MCPTPYRTLKLFVRKVPGMDRCVPTVLPVTRLMERITTSPVESPERIAMSSSPRITSVCELLFKVMVEEFSSPELFTSVPELVNELVPVTLPSESSEFTRAVPRTSG